MCDGCGTAALLSLSDARSKRTLNGDKIGSMAKAADAASRPNSFLPIISQMNSVIVSENVRRKYMFSLLEDTLKNACLNHPSVCAES